MEQQYIFCLFDDIIRSCPVVFVYDNSSTIGVADKIVLYKGVNRVVAASALYGNSILVYKPKDMIERT